MSKTKIVTGIKTLFSYAKVWEAELGKDAKPNEKPKYSCAILIPKSDTATIGKIKAAVAAAAEEGKGAKFGGKIPKNLKQPLRDGDTESDNEEYAGYMFFSASSTRKPQIVDANVNPILDQDEFYSGCIGRASINFYAFDVKTNKGIAAGLNNIQKLEDGERLGGGAASAEDDFGDDDDLS